jgi:hypothetical protein
VDSHVIANFGIMKGVICFLCFLWWWDMFCLVVFWMSVIAVCIGSSRCFITHLRNWTKMFLLLESSSVFASEFITVHIDGSWSNLRNYSCVVKRQLNEQRFTAILLCVGNIIPHRFHEPKFVITPVISMWSFSGEQ